MANLLSLVTSVSSEFNYGRTPDLSEFRNTINPILQVLYGFDMGSDTISEVSLDFEDEGSLFIMTEWGARCTPQNPKFEIPLSILRDEDPLKAAKVYSVNDKLAKSQATVLELTAKLAAAYAEFSKCQQEKTVMDLAEIPDET